MISTTLSITETDEDAIRDLVSRAEAAQNDSDALMELHTPDTAIVNIAGRRILGRDTFAKAMAAAMTSSLSDVQTSLDVIDVRLTTPDVAIVSCVKTVHDNRSDGAAASALPAAGALTYVMTRSDDGWRIALAQTTPMR